MIANITANRLQRFLEEIRNMTYYNLFTIILHLSVFTFFLHSLWFVYPQSLQCAIKKWLENVNGNYFQKQEFDLVVLNSRKRNTKKKRNAKCLGHKYYVKDGWKN